MTTMNDIRMANIRAGQHFFDSDTMRFFDSRVHPEVFEGAGDVLFITSEQFHGSDGRSNPRKYTIRRFHPATGGVTSASEFQAFASLFDARAAAEESIKEVSHG